MKKATHNFGNTFLIESFISNGNDKFTILEGENRVIDESHVKRLMESFVESGTASLKVTVLETDCFNGTKKRYLIDGQHSVIACQRLGLSFGVNVVGMKNDTPLGVTKYIATLNNYSKAWSNENFLTSFAKNGIKEYKILAEIQKNTGLKITDLLHIFLGGAGVKENKMFKSGLLSFVNKEDSIELLNAVAMVKPHIPNKAFIRRSLYKIMRLSRDYNKMAKAIVKTSKYLSMGNNKWSENESEFYDQLVTVYQDTFKVK